MGERVEGEGIQGEWGNKAGLLLQSKTAPDCPSSLYECLYAESGAFQLSETWF